MVVASSVSKKCQSSMSAPHSIINYFSRITASCFVEKNTSNYSVPRRDWVVPNEPSGYGRVGVSGGSRRGAWFATLAGSSDKPGEVLAVERGRTGDVEDRRLQRRQRSENGGGGVVTVGSTDLLVIPGVGPRNLRKLVEKGFEGVAHLKQLYRDKIYIVFFNN